MKQSKNYNKFVLVAMVVLLAVVLFMGGSTYAKYITTQEVPTQQATVAKWGYVITTNVDNFFGTDYTKSEGNYATVVADSGASVSASTVAKVVAPGTSGSMTISIRGKAEVLSKLTIEVTDANPIQLTQAPNESGLQDVSYEPIKWTVTGKTSEEMAAGELLRPTSLSGLKDYLDGLSNPSIDPNEEIYFELTISWEWAFEDNNAYDTMLGDLAALNSEELIAKYGAGKVPTGNTTMSIGLQVTVEQIQNEVQQNPTN